MHPGVPPTRTIPDAAESKPGGLIQRNIPERLPQERVQFLEHQALSCNRASGSPVIRCAFQPANNPRWLLRQRRWHRFEGLEDGLDER